MEPVKRTHRTLQVSKFWETLPYRLDINTGLIDYDELALFARRFRPKLLIAGTTAYSRVVDMQKVRAVADEVGT